MENDHNDGGGVFTVEQLFQSPLISNISFTVHGYCLFKFLESDRIKAVHCLQQHQIKVLTGEDEEDVQVIAVRRSNLLDDTFNKFSKSSTNVSKKLKIIFIGEPSIDDGGPRREFFQLLCKDLFVKTGFFVGWPSNVVPVPDTDAVAKNKFYTIGRILATCLVQGGEAPSCFSYAVAEFLVYDEVKSEPCILDIADESVRQKLRKIQEATSIEDLRMVLSDEAQFLNSCGFRRDTAVVSLTDKDVVIKFVWLHYVMKRVHAELQQLKNGLRDTLQMEAFAIFHPRELLVCLASSCLFDVTPSFFINSYTIKYSLIRSNSRTHEEAIILHWTDYVQDCYDNSSVHAADGGPRVLLKDLLRFLSGASKIPAAGFQEIPSIIFEEYDGFPLPSTCDLSLTFPRNYGVLSYNDFKQKMDYAVMNSPGFGTP